jgi:anti-sigma factor RsiW
MYCVRSSQELASLMDGELAPAQAAELQRHVAECAVCRRELSRHKQTASLVGTLTEVEPPQDLRARIQRKAAQPRPAAALTCSSTCEMLDGYAHGELARDAAEAVFAHLCECVECSRELDRIEESVGLLGVLPDVAPPARIRDSVRHARAKRARPIYARPVFRGMVATFGTAVAAAAVMLVMRLPAGNQVPVPVATKPPAPAPAPAATPTAPTTERVERGTAVVSRPAPDSASRAPARTSTIRTLVAGLTGSSRKPAVSDHPARSPVDASYGARTSAASEAISAETAGAEAPASTPVATPAPQMTAALTGPAAEPESAAGSEELPRPHPARESIRASAAATVESPLAEVRRILRNDQTPAPRTVRSKREPDRLATGPISPWGF